MDTRNKEWNIKVVFITFYKFSVTEKPSPHRKKGIILYEIVYACTINKGKKRKINQDNIVCHQTYLDYREENNAYHDKRRISLRHPVMVGVFDGLGGEQCGEIASYIAAREAAQLSFDHNISLVLMEYIRKANRKICDFALSNGIVSMGTTAALTVFDKKKLYVCNIGDSKIFFLQNGQLIQLSKDHIAQLPYGIKAPLTQCLGIPEERLQLEPHFFTAPLHNGNIFLLCSDGLTDMVELSEINAILSAETPEHASEMLVQKALEYGGKDNVSVIVCKAVRKKLFQKRKEGINNVGK